MPDVIAFAERRALAVGVTADRVLIAAGLISEEAYMRALARHVGLGFEPIDWRGRGDCPLPDARLLQAAAGGIVAIADGAHPCAVLAPQGLAARRLVELAGTPQFPTAIRLTSGERLRRFVRREADAALGTAAAFGLARAQPRLSAAPRNACQRPWRGLAAALAVVAGAAAVPGPAAGVLGVVLGSLFLAWIAMRLLAVVTSPTRPPTVPRVADSSLPVYTVVVALYRESAAVPQLVAALDRLDYPPEKLQIMLVLERDDPATRRAVEACAVAPRYELVFVPNLGPRTKPKALNVALPFVRGEFLAVFDAEDRPDPDQLRIAVAAFLYAGERVACVQARLSIDNTGDGWLATMFTAEYAGLFDVLLPALARWRLPLPLGGSSNHFRTAILRRLGGWDAFNVTEDADLGIRLARAGFGTAMIAARTLEEAPARLQPWLRQRTRWFQGWMQTWLVHMREPARAWHDLGPAGFLTFQLVVGGTVLSALVHPVFVIACAAGLAARGVPEAPSVLASTLELFFAGTFLAGYLSSILLGGIGLARHRLLAAGWVLLLMPIHWLLLSTAAWRALGKLFRDPYRWDKTEHGLARTSRLSAAASAAGPGQAAARRRAAVSRARPKSLSSAPSSRA